MLNVVATTNLVADVAAQVAGDHAEVTTLLPVGADPHAFAATPQDLRTLNQADVIFINGLGLEEALLPVLENLDSGASVVSVNAGVTPLALGEDQTGGEHHHEGIDPHTWFDVASVATWTDNVRQVLSTLDPANADAYAANAAAYAETLATLDEELRATVATLPREQRKLVTDHDEFGYFARAYDFDVIGAVIPALSTLAEPSAQELAALQEQIQAEGVPAIFVGTTINPDLEQQLAQDLGVELVTLYTASLSEPDGPAPSYVGLMRNTVRTIVTSLR
jgi:zinc/manganese transport system substrate-binding protein/manganese/iron transport system substrate-binding protein